MGQEPEGSQSTNRNQPAPGSGRGGRLRRELSPGDSSAKRHGALLTRMATGMRWERRRAELACGRYTLHHSYPLGIASRSAKESCSPRPARTAPVNGNHSMRGLRARPRSIIANQLSPGDSSTEIHGRPLQGLIAPSGQPLRRRSRSRSMCCRATSDGTTLRGG